MRETQRAAWGALQDSISGKRAAVLEVIKSREGATMFEVAQALGWPINRVSGRITELCDRELVEDSGERKINPLSGKRVIVWKVTGQSVG
jgi:DNA-binding MarR family transcriptional regulator